MREYKTNFDLLADLLEISGTEITREIGADKTLIYRWRSGARRLVAGRHWINKIVNLFIDKDARLARPVLAELLNEAYPIGDARGDGLREPLAAWLTAKGQNAPDEIARRLALYAKFITLKTEKRMAPEQPPEQTKKAARTEPPAHMPARIVTGVAETRETVASVFDYLAMLHEPAQVVFVCPEGLDLITRDEAYFQKILHKLNASLSKGHKLDVVLRTDYRMSDVSATAGQWLTAHLMGYVKSWYYDDFRRVGTDNMLFIVKGRLAVRVSGKEPACETFTDAPTLALLEESSLAYLRQSVQRFRYGFFENPEGYLSDVRNLTGAPSYLFQRLPHFSVGGEAWLARMGLTNSEVEYVKEQFAPLLISPDQFGANVPVYHIFCMDAIEDALDKVKHMQFALCSMLNRRSYVYTQTLVYQLAEIARLLRECENYHVCFVGADTFDKMALEIGVWSDAVAIGWLPGKQSTVTKDHFNAAALQGYCGTLWDRMPNAAKSKSAANRALSKLLGRAEKFGYAVK